MKILGPGSAKHSPDRRRQFAAVNDIRINHHSGSIKRPQGQKPRGEDLRNLIDRELSVGSVLAHENRVSRLIWSRDR
jgi:hypothetical protein